MKLYAKFIGFLGYDENKNEIHLKGRYLGEDKDWSKVFVLEDKQQILWKNIIDSFKQEGETDLDCSRRLGIHFKVKFSAVFDSKMFDEPITDLTEFIGEEASKNINKENEENKKWGILLN